MSNIDAMNEGPQWYVAHTVTGHENKVKDNLQRIIANNGLEDSFFDIKIPTETIIQKNGDKEKIIEEKLYPCYVYIKMIMTDKTWHVVRNISGVTGFVGPGSRPTPLPKEEVEGIGLEGDVTKNVSVAVQFGVGDEVEIIDPMFDGFHGVVHSISEDLKTVTVLIKRGSRDMPVELEVSKVKLAK